MLQKKLLLIFSLICLNNLAIYAKTVHILPLGDSITYDTSYQDVDDPRPVSERYGYRGYLWQMLTEKKIDFDFVGTKKAGQDFAPDFDPDNDGYPGETSFEIAERTYDIVEKTQPDVILLHIGTNDNDTNVDGINKILEMVDVREGVESREIRVIVALIIDRKDPDSKIKIFNDNLKKLLDKRWKNGDILTVVDMYHDAGLTKDDYVDNTHPNANGYAKIAKVWFDAINIPYVPFSTAPFLRDDNINAETSSDVSISVLKNDIDYQGDMDISSVTFSNENTKLSVTGEGTWTVNSSGIVTFKPNDNFFTDPTPVQYTVKDKEGTVSKSATITINYSNASLETFPTSIVPKDYIDSIDIDEATNSVTFITRVPNIGIKF